MHVVVVVDSKEEDVEDISEVVVEVVDVVELSAVVDVVSSSGLSLVLELGLRVGLKTCIFFTPCLSFCPKYYLLLQLYKLSNTVL